MDLLKPNERIDYMYNDDLQIIQEKDAFSFSLDTLLLGYFAQNKIHDNYKVVDLCSGNGAASIYMSYFNRAHYDAVEIQKEIADQARRSIKLNKLENRIEVHCLNALDAPKKLGKDKYDVVVVNPPYFKVPKGHIVNPDEKKALARHELAINLEQIIKVSSGFQTSVNIAYDLRNESKIYSFIPTNSSIDLIYDLLSGTNDGSTQRAKILTGAYGRGKSHIVLVALSILSEGKNRDFYKKLLDRMKDYNEDVKETTETVGEEVNGNDG